MQKICAASTLPLVHAMIENDDIRQFDRQGRSFFDLPWSEDLEKLEEAVRRFLGMADKMTDES